MDWRSFTLKSHKTHIKFPLAVKFWRSKGWGWSREKHYHRYRCSWPCWGCERNGQCHTYRCIIFVEYCDYKLIIIHSQPYKLLSYAEHLWRTFINNQTSSRWQYTYFFLFSIICLSLILKKKTRIFNSSFFSGTQRTVMFYNLIFFFTYGHFRRQGTVLSLLIRKKE